MTNPKRLRRNDVPESSIKNARPDPGQEGLRLLAKMIARVYLDEIARERRAMLQEDPRVFLEIIHITARDIDVNNPKHRQKLHSLIDEALDRMTLEITTGRESPWVFRKGGVTIKMKV